MWFMPSYGRPERLHELLTAPGGWPQDVVVVVNQDDPQRKAYSLGALKTPPWLVSFVPPGSRCADAHRYASTTWPNEPFYGLLCDDQWPITLGWWQAMEQAAEDRYVATVNGEPSFPLCRTAVCIGGGLVRTMGSLVPAAVKHNFEDNIWDDVAREHDLLRPLPNHFVEHRHWIRGAAERDATYERGSADFASDQAIYEQWLTSDEKAMMNERIRAFLNV